MILFYFEVFLCLLFTIYLYLKYADKKIPLWIGVLVIIVWFLNFVAAVIVPFDILLSLKTPIENIPINYVEKRRLYDSIYEFDYWIIYILSWIIIPVAQEYVIGTELTKKEKLKGAIKRNLVFYAIIGVVGFIFILYLIYNKELSELHLQGFLISLSNAWGLFIIIFLLAYGLVEIPKELFILSDYENRSKYLEWLAGKCQHNLSKKEERRKNLKEQLNQMELSNFSQIDKKFLIERLSKDEILPNDDIVLLSKEKNGEKFIDLINEKSRYKSELRIFSMELDDIFDEWYFLNCLMQRENFTGLKARDNNFNSNSEAINRGKCQKIYDFYYLKIRPILLKFFGVICAIFSIAIILSEITLFVDFKFSIFGFFIEKARNIYVMNILVLLPLIFLFLTSLYGLFNLKITGMYHISKSQNSDSSSLLFLSGFICKIGFPLCLNFLQIVRIRTYKTSLESFLGVMDFFPVFGNNFSIFYPAALLIFISLNLFNIFGKLSSLMGFSAYGFKTEENDEILEDGLDKLNTKKIKYERERTNKPDWGGYEEFNNNNRRDTYLGSEINDI